MLLLSTLAGGSHPQSSAHNWKHYAYPYLCIIIKSPSQSPFPALSNHFRPTWEAYSILLQNTYFGCTKTYLMLLHFVYCPLKILSVLQIESLCNPVPSKSIGSIFRKAFYHSVSLCHILAILTISQPSSLLLYLL